MSPSQQGVKPAFETARWVRQQLEICHKHLSEKIEKFRDNELKDRQIRATADFPKRVSRLLCDETDYRHIQHDENWWLPDKRSPEVLRHGLSLQVSRARPEGHFDCDHGDRPVDCRKCNMQCQDTHYPEKVANGHDWLQAGDIELDMQLMPEEERMKMAQAFRESSTFNQAVPLSDLTNTLQAFT